MNKYLNWYDSIIANGKTQREHGYECHHILPKSLGGTDIKSNLVYITAREHFICHWLLTKIYPTGEEHWKMLNALRMMRAENKNQQRYQTKITSRVYAKLKEEYSQMQSERYNGENNPMYGDKFYRSEEGFKKQKEAVTGDKNGSKQIDARRKISESKLGKKRDSFSEEWKQNIAKAVTGDNNGMFGKKHSEETKIKQREKAIGRKQSSETIAKKAEAIRGSKREKKHCPHCGKQVAVNGYARWHGDNCKILFFNNDKYSIR
jgi:hypothetical protein